MRRLIVATVLMAALAVAAATESGTGRSAPAQAGLESITSALHFRNIGPFPDIAPDAFVIQYWQYWQYWLREKSASPARITIADASGRVLSELTGPPTPASLA